MSVNFHPNSLFYMIIGLLLGMVIGWLIGFFDSNNRSSHKIQASEAKAEAAIAEANSRNFQPQQEITFASTPAQNVRDDPGLLRVKNDNGRFLVEMDGAQIVPPLPWEKRKRLIELVTVFRSYLETGQLSQATLQSPTTPLPSPSMPGSSQPGGVPPVQPAAKKPEITNLSIVGQIDTILQKRLMTGPFANTGIRLQDAMRGGVEVFVGSQKYVSIDEVPDPAVKNEIRAAITEWEQRFTPK